MTEPLTYGPGRIDVERVGDGVLITARTVSGHGTTIHLPRAADAEALGKELVKVATTDPDLDAELAALETCGASILLPASDAHVCLCLTRRHDGEHCCDECGTRWSA